MTPRQRSFVDDERGMESLQAVLILAIAAIVLGLVKLFWPVLRDWTTEWLREIMH